MAEDALQVVDLQDDFYRDGFAVVVAVFIGIFAGIALLVAVSVYMYMQKPVPVTFLAANEWRVQPDIPLDQPYRTTPDILQWTSDAVLNMFIFDFNNYDNQLKEASQYFTADGWKVFSNHLNIHVNYTNVQTDKLFVSAVPLGTPSLLNQGVLSGRYAWWVQMPIQISYVNFERSSTEDLTLQLLVVRVPTLNNLNGLGIDNVIILTKGSRPLGNG